MFQYGIYRHCRHSFLPVVANLERIRCVAFLKVSGREYQVSGFYQHAVTTD